MRIVVLASDKYYWLLRGFDYQWNKYAQDMLGGYEIAGFTRYDIGRKFSSMGRFEDYPVERWSDAVIGYLNSIPDEQILFMLEDYWLIREVDAEAVKYAFEFMRQNPQALRFDLTTDRLYCKAGVEDFAYYKRLDVIRANFGEYHVSTQAGVWNKTPMLNVLKAGESPWEFEINGSVRAENLPANEVYGFRQCPIKYQIMYRGGVFEKDGSWMKPSKQLIPSDIEELEKMGYTKP